jgi:hypothetical protein
VDIENFLDAGFCINVQTGVFFKFPVRLVEMFLVGRAAVRNRRRSHYLMLLESGGLQDSAAFFEWEPVPPVTSPRDCAFIALGGGRSGYGIMRVRLARGRADRSPRS